MVVGHRTCDGDHIYIILLFLHDVVLIILVSCFMLIVAYRITAMSRDQFDGIPMYPRGIVLSPDHRRIATGCVTTVEYLLFKAWLLVNLVVRSTFRNTLRNFYRTNNKTTDCQSNSTFQKI